MTAVYSIARAGKRSRWAIWFGAEDVQWRLSSARTPWSPLETRWMEVVAPMAIGTTTAADAEAAVKRVAPHATRVLADCALQIVGNLRDRRRCLEKARVVLARVQADARFESEFHHAVSWKETFGPGLHQWEAFRSVRLRLGKMVGLNVFDDAAFKFRLNVAGGGSAADERMTALEQRLEMVEAQLQDDGARLDAEIIIGYALRLFRGDDLGRLFERRSGHCDEHEDCAEYPELARACYAQRALAPIAATG